MTVTAQQVKELRERTNAGMMECKKALIASNGDMEAAIKAMRESGLAKAAGKASRLTAEGMITSAMSKDNKFAVVIEVNCETDFVAREQQFRDFNKEVATYAAEHKIKDVNALAEHFDKQRLELITRIGENISIRRLGFVEAANNGIISAYMHGDPLNPKIGVLVQVEGGDQVFAKDIAMHVAAMSPEYLTAAEIPADRLKLEKEISLKLLQDREPNKPVEILEKMADGKVEKDFVKQVVLLSQAFVKGGNTKVEEIAKQNNAKIVKFVRFEVGEGIEKKSNDFASEVMAQAQIK